MSQEIHTDSEHVINYTIVALVGMLAGFIIGCVFGRIFDPVRPDAESGTVHPRLILPRQ